MGKQSLLRRLEEEGLQKGMRGESNGNLHYCYENTPNVVDYKGRIGLSPLTDYHNDSVGWNTLSS